ncbi:hypothetical protein ARMSODRAFT_104077 [Armillaria solidipes]|uniref:Uncharacterized protein n=1 Tax=Armillaria solidipes TaxID=1076256 RepID=A0A2H3AI95_9AGAR|nr:hypothetical protein ARMSODRAFT_104077 [Armillaria solidipes]
MEKMNRSLVCPAYVGVRFPEPGRYWFTRLPAALVRGVYPGSMLSFEALAQGFYDLPDRYLHMLLAAPRLYNLILYPLCTKSNFARLDWGLRRTRPSLKKFLFIKPGGNLSVESQPKNDLGAKIS